MINRRERKKELTKEIIIDSALALFEEKGFSRNLYGGNSNEIRYF